MSIRHLEALYEPKTVAVIGASESENSIAGTITRHVVEKFQGTVRLVNPNRTTVLGHPSLTAIADLPEAPDMALVTTPADGVLESLEALGAKGAKGAVIISDPKRGRMSAADVRRRIMEIARTYTMRINGPNCLGISVPSIGLHASMSQLEGRTGSIAFIGQSATAAAPLIDWANLKGLGFSYLISLGDMVDVDYADVLFFLAGCRRTRCIVLYAERLPNARRFMSAARHAARTKPVIIMKAGALTGNFLPEGAEIDPDLPSRDAVYEGAFRRAGLLRVRTLEALYDAVEALSARLPADAPAGLGRRLTILANGESMGTLAMDRLVESQGHLAALSPETVEALSKVLPPGRPRSNPVDILPDATGERYEAALGVLMGDKNTDALLTLFGPTGVASATETAQAVARAVEKARRTPGRRRPWVLTSWPGGAEATAARKVLTDAHIPTFDTPSTAVSVFRVLLNHRMITKGLQETPASIPAAFDGDPVTARTILSEARTAERAQLDGADARAVLACYGLHMADRAETAPVLPVAWRIATAVDPEFGPVLIFGLGGDQGRLLDDPVVGLPPLNQTLARDVVLSHPAGDRLFAAYNETPALEAQLDVLALALSQVSQMLVDLPDLGRIEIDLLTVGETGIVFDKAVIRPSTAHETVEDREGRLAIRPYPKELEDTITSRKGLELILRPIRPEDEPALGHMFSQLSEDDIRRRFFRPLRQMDHDFMAGLTQIDYDWHMAFVLTRPGLPGEADILGVVRLVREHGEDTGEYAVVVRSDTQGHGLGRLLMERIIAYARDIGLEAIYGLVLADNASMLGLNRKLGFTVKREADEPGILRVTLKL